MGTGIAEVGAKRMAGKDEVPAGRCQILRIGREPFVFSKGLEDGMDRILRFDGAVAGRQPGAERLLGRGDMLYMSSDSPAPQRLQGVFVSDTEISNITRFWRQQMDDSDRAAAGRLNLSQFALDEMSKDSSRGSSGGGQVRQQAFWDRESGPASFVSSREPDDEDMGDGEDEMYDEAVKLVRTLKKASVSLLQRRLRIGYTRAARLIDLMEENGVVGPAQSGSTPREVIG